MDRNDTVQVVVVKMDVALRKESVDRNRTPHHKNTRPIPSLSARRAWIEIKIWYCGTSIGLSLSARRAWIEIPRPSITGYFFESLSARRAWIEIIVTSSTVIVILSLSARRAWIEIEDWLNAGALSRVALRKESVDRNSTYVTRLPRAQGRSPQGERG